MTQPEKCPICGGSGKSPYTGETTSATPTACHGCYGRGWVEISDDGGRCSNCGKTTDRSALVSEWCVCGYGLSKP